MKIAVVQMGVREDKFENMSRAAGFVAQAAAKGADIVVLPEMFNCPYQTRNFPVYAEKSGGECWQILADAARDSHVYLVGGSIPERDDEGRVYNTSFVFDRAGDQIARCRKTHMFDIDVPGGQRFKESETLTPGSEITTFDTEFGTMGLLICYDIRFPEMMRVMANRGAKVVFVPAAFNMTTGPAHWELLFRCRAADYQLFTVGAAPQIPSSFPRGGKCSCVWGPVRRSASTTSAWARSIASALNCRCATTTSRRCTKRRRNCSRLFKTYEPSAAVFLRPR